MDIKAKLPVVGEEYWDREAQVRFYHLARFAKKDELTIETEAWFEGWTGSITGRLHWEASDIGSDEITQLHLGSQNVDKYRTQCFYLRPRHIEGAEGRETALPGESLRIRALERADVDELSPYNWRESRRERILRSLYLILSKA